MGRVRKKRRQELPPSTKGKKRVGRNVGKLMKMLDVPMDVFFEIASYLEPVDILQLARASRDLRSTLMSRSSRHVWVAARGNVDPPLPDCPDFLSEPEYAYLVFERFCEECGAGRAMNVDYALRVRLCRTCWKENVKRGHQLAKEMDLKKDKEALRVIYNLLPKATCEWFESEDPRLEELNQISRDLFYEPEFIDTVEAYLDVRDRGDDDELEKFIQECVDFTLDRLNFHRDVIEWYREARAEKKAAGVDAKGEREDAIERKLSELGWKRADWPYISRRFYNMVHQPRPLTDRIWNTIRPKLVALLEEEKRDREIEKFNLKWRIRRQQLSGHYRTFLRKTRDPVQQQMLPGFQDALELPCMQALLTSKDPDQEVTLGDFSAIEPAIQAEAEVYRDEVYSNLVSIWQEHLDECEQQRTAVSSQEEAEPPRASQKMQKRKKKADPIGGSIPALDPAARLALLDEPTTFFTCTLGMWWRYDCSKPMSYIGIMEHWRTQHGDTRCSRGALGSDGGCYTTHLPYLLGTLGLEAKTTTHAELHQLITSGRPSGHISQARWSAPYERTSVKETAKAHRITFEPFDEGASS
ncbi:hypothetical protein L226DRAFT_572160 [Lentinus tigrinus ALCF2SS1-7]|uniref:F-box domain-containing protein n=1 Tax=Lentinus tigrinus ALCF2SS1-6 TaxID=1328759 RepID=A0A5C2S770_9APHY|nr:hypothetical protein L227DRAFT_654178 [Lentinus tigrinus ALCF2SS1-6]RPD73488.1 hypothetical protein L226DRAFT_572160 [Lentinus tigrinus ALCF2SS1-7]